MKFFLILSFTAVICTILCCVGGTTTAACDGHNITHVALNSTSFPCPVSVVSCKSGTMNDLIATSTAASRKLCVNEVILQSGSYDVMKAGSRSLTLLASRDLVFWGHTDVTITCTDDSTISLSLAFNITVREIQFQTCSIALVTSPLHSSTRVEITKCTFSGSQLQIQASGKRLGNALFVTMDNVHAINSTIALSKSSSLTIRGYSRSNVAISCDKSQIFVDIAPQKAVIFNSVNIQDCKSIIFLSRTKSATIGISHSWFNNSCLSYIPTQTRSASHVASVTLINTTIEQCSCGYAMSFNGSKINVRITFCNVNITDNTSPILNSQGGNIYVHVLINGSNIFSRNEDFIFYLETATLKFSKSQVHFIDNIVGSNVVQGTPIYAKSSTISFENSNILFSQNQGQLCGGIAAESSRIYFYDDVNIKFYSNGGLKGGALSLYSNSMLIFYATQSNITIEFQNNNAQVGGAIYVEDSEYGLIKSIFYLRCKISHIKLIFGADNVASFSGNQIYGGWIDWLTSPNHSAPENHQKLVNKFVIFDSPNNEEVTCNPIRICMCVNNSANCTIVSQSMQIYGKAFSLSLVGVGQRYTPVLSHVKATLASKNSSICPEKFSLQSHCTTVEYKIEPQSNVLDENITFTPYLPYLYYSTHTHHLQTEGIVGYLFQNLSLRLQINKCPWGFGLNDNGNCECQLSVQDLHCDVSNYTILRSTQQWIGVTFEHNHGRNNPGVIAHQYCPFDYCRSDNKSLSIRLESHDEQCAFNRVGILCGGCKENLSRVLGTSSCSECTNKYMVLITVSWLISGIILVTCLMLLNLTVSVGTINGLTFYANII